MMRPRYSSANNHLVGEAAALFFVGLLFPEIKHSGKWQERGQKILVEEIEKQTFPDGVGKEQSTHYLGFILEFYLQMTILMHLKNIELPRIVPDRIEKMCDFLMNTMDSSGRIPMIGDGDDGYAVKLSEEDGFNNSRSILATAAVLLNRGDFKKCSKIYDEKTFWLLGIEGHKKYQQIPILDNAPGSKSFPYGGYYIMREGTTEAERKLVFDCGNLGYSAMAAHAHELCAHDDQKQAFPCSLFKMEIPY